MMYHLMIDNNNYHINNEILKLNFIFLRNNQIDN